MSRLEENLEIDIERHLETGWDNAECKRKMEEWCQHVEIRPESVGELAIISDLPIGLYSLECPKVEFKAWSSVFRRTFGEFLEEHCTNCPHHAPNGDISWGQGIIEKRREEAQEREQAAAEEAARISQLRSDLRGQSKEISSEAEPESYQILTYFEMIFSEDEAERKKASLRLQESAMLGADLFPEAAIDLLLLLSGTPDYAELILPICAGLAGRRSERDHRFVQVALNNIEKNLHPELSASIIIVFGESVKYPLSDVYIKRLLLAQEHVFHPRGFPSNEDPDYSHSTEVLIRCYDADSESLLRIIRRELQNEADDVRFQLCTAVELIQSERPQLAADLLHDLVRSLELSEDTFGGVVQPSHKIIGILRTTLRYSAEKVDQVLSEAMLSVRPAVQGDIINVYRGILFDRDISWEERREYRNRTEVSEPEKIAIQRLLGWSKDDRFDLDVRFQALEALEVASEYSTSEMLTHFDSLLGYCAILCGQERPPDPSPQILTLYPKQPIHPIAEQFDEMSRELKWRNLKQRLQKCLEELCRVKPTETFDTVFDCLKQPSEHLENEFKAFGMILLGVLGRNFALRGRALPLLWRGLMDYESAWVRAKAIDAAVEMFSSSSSSPPENMVDIILVHLRDPKVVVHQAAWRAVSWRPSWFDQKQAHEALSYLGGYLHPYNDEKYHLKDICDAILKIGRREKHLKPSALRVVTSIFPTGEKHVDRAIVENMIRICEPSEEIAWLIAKHIGTFLARYRRDHFDDYRRSERLRMFEWLHLLPTATFHRVADGLLVSAKRVAKRDHWEACYFASLFSHFRDFRCEQIVLDTAKDALSEEPRDKRSRSRLKQFARAAAGSASLQAGDRTLAEAYFGEG